MSQPFYTLKTLRNIYLWTASLMLLFLLICVFLNLSTWHWKLIIPGIILGILLGLLIVSTGSKKIKGNLFYPGDTSHFFPKIFLAAAIGGSIGGIITGIISKRDLEVSKFIFSLFFKNIMVGTLVASIICLVWIIRYERKNLKQFPKTPKINK